MEWQQLLFDLLGELAIVAVPIIFGYVAVAAKRALEAGEKKAIATIGDSWWYALETAAAVLIRSAEQTAGIETNEQKKAFVLARLTEWATAASIEVNEELLDAIIEGVFAAIKERVGDDSVTAEVVLDA